MPVGSVAVPAKPFGSSSRLAVPSNPSRTRWYTEALRDLTVMDGSSIGVEPLITNSQSSCDGCHANFVKPGLVTVPAPSPADWWVSRPGSAPWSMVVATRSKNSRSDTGVAPAHSSCSR